MSKFEKYQTLIIFAAMPIGLLIGQFPPIEQNAQYFVTPFLFIMLIGAFLNIPLKDYRKAFSNRSFSITAILINFVWTPLLVWVLGELFLSHSPAMQMGFIMLMVTPCTDWYLIFTGLAKGNVPLSATLLPANLVLQVILLPIYLFIFGGVTGTINLHEVINSVVIMLLLPFVLAQIGKWLIHKIQLKKKKELILYLFGNTQTILLAMAITAMFAAKGKQLVANLNIVVILIIPILLFYIINFILAQGTGKGFHYSYEDTASLTLTTIAKNSPMTLGVALMAFPNEPIIHLIMVIEPLIELPAMLLITKILLVIRKRKLSNTSI